MRISKLAIAVLIAAACSKAVKVETDPSAAKVDVDVQKPGVAETWNATLASVGGSTVTGTAKGTTANETTNVTITVSGGTPGATYPWHVHEGKCGDASPPVVGPMSAYPPIVVGSDGTGTASASFTPKLNEAKNYIVNVHASPTNLGTIVACGDYND